MRSIAIASFTDGSRGMCLPEGDCLLRTALEGDGWRVSQGVWSDPAFDWSRMDAVVIRSCWDYHLRPDAFAAWVHRVEQAGVTIVNAPALIRWNLDKRYLRALERAGIPIPQTHWLEDDSGCDVAAVCREREWSAAVVKPLISASAHRTALRSSGMAHGPAMIQEYLPEIATEGEWSLMYFGGVFSHAVRKRPARGDFRVQKEFGGSDEAAVPSRDLITFGARTLAQAPVAPALARVDIVETASRGPLLMELEAIEPELFFGAAPASEYAACAAITAAALRN